MTLRRQERNGGLAVAGFLLALLLTASGVEPALAQATTERVVINRLTGLAISGFDPVAYFTEGVAAAGTEQFEAVRDGAVWRFRNEGNRAAFMAHPEVYGPQFGGHDPVDAARGRVVEGLPNVWQIHNQRLFLFASEAGRAAFSVDPDGFFKAAERQWPKLKAGLVR